MFLLRCTFFLAIVYVSIAFGSGAPRSPHPFETALATQASGVVDVALARATDWCAERPSRCARDAARLTTLVETTMAESVSGGDEIVLPEAGQPVVPQPVRDPRRRNARAGLTGTR